MKDKNKKALGALKSKTVKKPSTLSDASKRDKRLIVYISSDELEKLKDKAKQKGYKSLSSFMLHMALYQ